VNISITKTGFSDDSKYMGVMQARLDQTLFELKMMISIMPYFAGQDISLECLRLREVKSDLFFGTVFRGNEKTLKNLGFEASTSLVVQVFEGSLWRFLIFYRYWRSQRILVKKLLSCI